MKYKSLLTKNKRQYCSVCGKYIPSYIERFSKLLGHNSYGGSVGIRICPYCITMLYNALDKESCKEFMKTRLNEELVESI